MTREELIERIKETAYLEGDFTLRSGKKSKYYLDKYLFETCPDVLKALGEEFAKYVTDDVNVIAGAELGGVALAAATAMQTNKNWIIVRNTKKGYGTGKLVEGVLKPDDIVLLVEDIATTSQLPAARSLKQPRLSLKPEQR
jgi:orotate phosphoribosyltransferase